VRHAHPPEIKVTNSTRKTSLSADFVNPFLIFFDLDLDALSEHNVL